MSEWKRRFTTNSGKAVRATASRVNEAVPRSEALLQSLLDRSIGFGCTISYDIVVWPLLLAR